MGGGLYKCLCNDTDGQDEYGSYDQDLKNETPNYQMTKAETALKAALLIQQWFRRYRARLEVRRRYTWTIFQSIEYSGEQDQIKLHNFFNALLTHVDQGNKTEVIEALSPRSSPILAENDILRRNTYSDINLLSISTDSSYKGPHLKLPLTTESVQNLIDAFRKKKRLHAKYAALLLVEATKTVKRRATITRASTAISGQITVVGDLHGKLGDLFTILYKNGLPSTDNPYVFNGDFVDRGKRSVEVLLMLAALVATFPSEVYLNRGNHEDIVMNARYGFCKEVTRKFKGSQGPLIMRLIEDFYRWLPVATIIDNKVFVVHGGISDGVDIGKMMNIDREKYVSVLRLPIDSMITEDDLDIENLNPDNMSISSLERIEAANNEWRQVLDLLWSDPHTTLGCCPNYFRGGGSYYGPDISQEFLKANGFQLLIRSHECKVDGYEFMHDKKCLTIFSASNYYHMGSNKGAYVTLQGPQLEPHFVQYMTQARAKPTTMRQRVGRMERCAMRELKNQIIASKSSILEGFKEHDPTNSGLIPVKDWVKVLEDRSHLDLPWRVLRERIVSVDKNTGKVLYETTFNQEKVGHKLPIKSGPTVVEALYRHKSNLESIFRLIDKDNSGFISMEEFSEVCKLVSRHVDVPIAEDEISDLAKSIDINKDGLIDFNEFLECFRIVDSQNRIHCKELEDTSESDSESESDDTESSE